MVLIDRQPAVALLQGEGDIGIGQRPDRRDRFPLSMPRGREPFVQGVQSALVHLDDQIVEIVEDQIQAADGIADMSGDLARAQCGQSALGDQMFGGLQGDFAQLGAAVLVTTTHRRSPRVSGTVKEASP